MLGCFDTKADDFNYMHACLIREGINVITMNSGIHESTTDFNIDISTEEIIDELEVDIQVLRNSTDRSFFIEQMGLGAARVISSLVSNESIQGAIGMGGGGGTYIALSAMQAIPLGIPKLCLTTIATKDLSRQVGVKDIVLFPSVVDVAGLNSISSRLISQAAGAIAGMAKALPLHHNKSKGTIGISIFGNTTECVNYCTDLLTQQGYEVLPFHAVGTGGLTMESLIRDGYIDAVLDITTTELADELCGGICSAGPSRLTAAAEKGIPQVVAPGCLDMVNFGHLDTVPTSYKDRLLYSWSPDVTLMRTNKQENKRLGHSIANKLNQSTGPVRILLPLQGISKVSGKEGVFHQPETDLVLFNAIKDHLNKNIEVVELNTQINDISFASRAVELLFSIL